MLAARRRGGGAPGARSERPLRSDLTRLDSIRARAVIRKPLRFLPRQTASQSSSVVRRLAVLLCTAALRFVILVQVCRLLLGACLRFRKWRRLADKLDWRLLLLRLVARPYRQMFVSESKPKGAAVAKSRHRLNSEGREGKVRQASVARPSGGCCCY
ncbi:hypothetical protein HDV57DRAFT_113905 [Trichoderma longibrachiatum]